MKNRTLEQKDDGSWKEAEPILYRRSSFLERIKKIIKILLKKEIEE